MYIYIYIVCHARCRRLGVHQGDKRGDRQRRRMLARTNINYIATRPSARPGCPAFALCTNFVVQTAVRATCQPLCRPASQGGGPPRTRDALPTPRAGLRIVLRGGKESRPALAFAFIPGHAVVLTASLPFACGSDGGCSNRAVTRNRDGRGRELGNAIRSAVILSRVGQGWESGDTSRSRSTRNRTYCPARSLLACV